MNPYRKMRAVHPRDIFGDEDDTRSHIRVPSLTKDEVDSFCKVVRRREARTTNGVEHGCDNRGTHCIHTIFFGLG